MTLLNVGNPGPAPSCSGLSCHLQHQGVGSCLSYSTTTQHPNGLGKTVGDGPSIWAPAHLVEDPDEASGSQLHPDPVLTFEVTWTVS